MSSKSKSVVPVLLTLAAVDAALAQAAEITAQANAAREQIKAKTETEVAAEVKGLLPRISKILGREFTMGELSGVVKAVEQERPLFASSAVRSGPVALTDEKRLALKAHMLGRAASVKAGLTPKTISSICEEVGCSPQTAPNYKPTASQVKGLPGDKEVPAEFYVADPVAA